MRVHLQVSIGDVYHRLTVIRESKRVKLGSPWTTKVQCVCGVIKEIRTTHLISGGTKSCGCLQREQSRRHLKLNKIATKHGKSTTRLNRIWRLMKNRCHNPNANNWKWYGGKGIRVCKAWHTFENFHIWATTNGYEEDLTIDRLRGSVNYQPSNCRWVTDHFQKSRKKSKL